MVQRCQIMCTDICVNNSEQVNHKNKILKNRKLLTTTAFKYTLPRILICDCATELDRTRRALE